VEAEFNAWVAGFFSPTTFWHAKSFEVGQATFGNQTTTGVCLDLHVRPFQEPAIL
jgi:hypothetical protein